jgi:ABC-type nickel/cobalt efflux system permease component RcnA
MRRLLIALAVALVFIPAAGAHPLGNFTVNQYARIQVSKAGVQVHFVLDQAEIPTLQMVQAHDADGSGKIDGAEIAAVRDGLVRDITGAVSLTVDGRPARLVPEGATLAFPHGQGGLSTTRLDLDLRADGVSLSTAPRQIAYTSAYATDRVGWKEVVVARAPGAAVTATTAATVDRTDGLRSYPKDVLASPASQLSATVDARLGDGGLAVGAVKTDGNVAAADAGRDRPGRLESLVDPNRPLTVGFVLVALLVAMGWGALHALTPGHGKTMVAAYLAGSRGTARHAFALGATVTVAHTATVFALGFVTLTLSEFILPEQLFPWLNLVSGLLVLSLGLAAIRQRLGGFRRARAAASAAEHDHDHGHSHDHASDHGHAHGHAHDHGERGHSHDPPDTLSWRSLLALGVSGGMIPCPSALVLLLGAIALDRTAFGVVLVCAFSLGLAGVVSGIGLAVLYARRLFARIPSSGRAIRVLPVASAAIITILGLVLTLRALPGLA